MNNQENSKLIEENNKPKSLNSKRTYDADFKNQIVAVCKSGVYESVAACAKAYDLSPNTLHTWLNQYKNKSMPAAISDQSAELIRVKKELARAKMELEILKKAAIYFANQAQ